MHSAILYYTILYYAILYYALLYLTMLCSVQRVIIYFYLLLELFVSAHRLKVLLCN